MIFLTQLFQYSNPDFSVLCVSDSGCGITCIADALQTFNSICNSGSNCEGKNDYYDNSGDKRGGGGGCIASDKKTISTLSRIGKYGVGLSSVFIYSQVTTSTMLYSHFF